MRQLFIRFHSAAAARRVLQLLSSKEPARRSSTARRHDTSSSARTLSPPPPRPPRGLRAKASRPRPNALSVDSVTPLPVLPLPVRMRWGPPCRLALVFCFLFPVSRLSLWPAGPQCSAPLVIGKAPKAGVTRKEKVDAVPSGAGKGVRRRGGANEERSRGCAVGFGRLRSVSLRVYWSWWSFSPQPPFSLQVSGCYFLGCVDSCVHEDSSGEELAKKTGKKKNAFFQQWSAPRCLLCFVFVNRW